MCVNAAEAKRKEEKEEEKKRKEEQVRAAAAAAAGDEYALNKLRFCGLCCMWLRVSLYVFVFTCVSVSVSVSVCACPFVSAYISGVLPFMFFCVFMCMCS